MSIVKIFVIHETFVGLWLASGLLQMLICSYLESKFYKRSSLIKLRRYLAGLAIFSEVFMLYLYFRHNNLCEPYMYSYFCLVEYGVIIINMIYHMGNPPMLKATINSVKNCINKNPSNDYQQLIEYQ